MSEKIELTEKLAAVDLNAKTLWDDIDDEQRKALKSELFILNRYISNVKTSNRDLQEHFVIIVNEYFNKHWYTLQKHPKLLWMLLCMCNYDGKTVMYHQWIGFKKKTTSNTKLIKFLSELYPDKKTDEIELLSSMMTGKEAMALAAEHGYDDKQIAKLFK